MATSTADGAEDARPRGASEASGRRSPTPHRSWMAVAVLVASSSIVALLTVTLEWIDDDRREAARTLAAQQLQRMTSLVTQVEADIGDIAGDVRFAADLARSSATRVEARRAFEALLGSVRAYRGAALYDAEGTAALLVSDPRKQRPLPDAMSAGMAAMAARMLSEPPAVIEVSEPVEAEGTEYRVFAMGLPPGSGEAARVITLAVDMQAVFLPLLQRPSDIQALVLVVNPKGRPLPISSPGVVAALSNSTGASVLQPLVERMLAGRTGSLDMDSAAALELGLPPGGLVAAYAPIRVGELPRWFVATITTADTLRAGEHQLAWRLGVLAASSVLIILLFAAFLVVSTRRQATLAARFQHATEIARLHEQAERILDSIPAGVLLLDERARITSINRALNGRAPEAVPGLTLAQALPRASDSSLRRLESVVESAAVGGGGGSTLWGERLVLFGSEGHYNVHAVPFAPVSPRHGTLVLVEDVTEMRILESRLVRAEKLSTVGVLAAGIAHEIGTPLGIVRGRAEYVLGKLGSDHPQAAFLMVITEQIDRITRTVTQLLDFSRPSVPEACPVQLAPVAAKCAELVGFETARRRVRLEIDVPRTLPSIVANPDELQQVLVNLMMNALDACSDRGRIRLEARAAADPASPHVIIAVVDDGHGIPAEELNRVFDPFYTTKKPGKGTGLGLAMVARIARNHGATIELDSAPGRGTRVELCWPTSGNLEVRRVG